MNKKKNLITALILQIATIISGLILPRLIISTFGSEINGLISSITQFLSFISLLEGGLGAVVLAELYKPIIDNDESKIKNILNACQRFFTQLSIIFICYTIILGLIYAWVLRDKFDFKYTCLLVYILSFTTLVQYLFSITYKLLLQAEQKIYIVNLISTITIILNLVFSIILIYLFPDIHTIKLCSAVAFLIQPLCFKRFIEKKYIIKSCNKSNNYELRNRWNGFAQNLAHFVNLNTDIVVISIFLTLSDVSVYSVYLLPITALRSIVSSLTNSYQSALGKYFALGDTILLNRNFNKFNTFNIFISIVLFSTCMLLINPFVSLYTSGIQDTNYYQPIFALIIVIANLLYCIREPYRYLILAAGKFKETNFGAIVEAVINIVISAILIRNYGLVGVALGTLVAILYRFIYFIYYFKNNILYKDVKKYFPNILKISLIILLNVYVLYNNKLKINNFFNFFEYGLVIFVIELSVSYIIFAVFRNRFEN